jgi:hypothetical protein
MGVLDAFIILDDINSSEEEIQEIHQRLTMQRASVWNYAKIIYKVNAHEFFHAKCRS